MDYGISTFCKKQLRYKASKTCCLSDLRLGNYDGVVNGGTGLQDSRKHGDWKGLIILAIKIICNLKLSMCSRYKFDFIYMPALLTNISFSLYSLFKGTFTKYYIYCCRTMSTCYVVKFQHLKNTEPLKCRQNSSGGGCSSLAGLSEKENHRQNTAWTSWHSIGWDSQTLKW